MRGGEKKKKKKTWIEPFPLKTPPVILIKTEPPIQEKKERLENK